MKLNSQISALVLATAGVVSMAPVAVQAQGAVAYAATTLNMRAGPGPDYPIVAIVPPSVQLLVQGCVPDYTWCDVLYAGFRGWVYAANINYPYQGRVVPLLDYGPAIGLTIFGFVLNDYWHDHYRDRRWYNDRDRWASPPHYYRPAPAPRPQFIPPRDTRPEHPRLPQDAAPIGPRTRPQPGVTPRAPREGQPGSRPGGQDRRRDRPGDDPRDGRRDGPGRGERQR